MTRCRIAEWSEELLREEWAASVPAEYAPLRPLTAKELAKRRRPDETKPRGEIVLPAPPAEMIEAFLAAIRIAERRDHDKPVILASGLPDKVRKRAA